MTRTAEEARSIAAEIVRLAKAADPDEYQFATELAHAEEGDVIDVITQDLLSDDTHLVFGWLFELALADTTNEQDRESAEDLQFRILFWIMAA